MGRLDRHFELIQLLRRATRAMTADELGARLEVTKRTVYRDIASLQAARVPIRGEAGVGYAMDPGYDLPPLAFDAGELEAIVVGLAMVGRAGDAQLLAAAGRASAKIADVVPAALAGTVQDPWLRASQWHAIPAAKVDAGLLRDGIRNEAKLALSYQSAGKTTERTVLPLEMFYYVDALVLCAWCELREDFRHFRLDRITACSLAGGHFRGQGRHLRAKLRAIGP
jgi:predicted DNA-binding transcriptional regulator YafY